MSLFSFKKALIAALCVLCLSVSNLPASAGLLSKLAREGADAAGSVGKKFDAPTPSLDDGIWFAKKLPTKEGAASLALLPGENGTWRIITETGQEVPLSSLDDVSDAAESVSSRTFKGLAGDAPTIKKMKGAQIAIRETDFFKLRDEMGVLPKNLDLQMVRESGKTLPLKQVHAGNRSRLVIELDKDVLFNPASLKALDANLKFLNTKVNKADLKIARFDSSRQAKEQAARQAVNDPNSILDPNLLESSLAKYKNRTLMVGGKVTTDPTTGKRTLSVKDGNRTVDLDLTALNSSASRQRVNLMVVDTGSTVQPGQILFSKTKLEKRFEEAQKAFTQADLMKAVTPPNSRTVINATEDTRTRISMTLHNSARAQSGDLAQTAPGSDYTTAGWLLEAGLRFGANRVEINAEDPDHTEEVKSRWIPWFKNIDIIVAGLFTVVFIFVSTKTWGWWTALWRLVGRKAKDDEDFSKGLRWTRAVTFVPFAAIMFMPGMIWVAIVSQVSFLTWPFRKLFGKSANAAT
ncbi:hypothetical protein TRICHSKD4_4768 [Roseibium sp. TrichSKD4]|uniref:hypothetical protein n=1 Tax=Roseibium sp. TrichSKD4 TaxID=744980 RepID=UPI0001E5714F|nr:hypothetical protein [Roseibium sp. TrichSKD4]EFO28955.1 hypothetical protein TRICHSKD4_4768 [Roseibium sp. TrichSKD4]